MTDLLRRRPIWFGGTDRSEASLTLFFQELGPKKCRGIYLAVMDMWKPFRNATKQHVPDVGILFDKFHVIGHLGEALDQVRKSEYARLTGKDRRFIKGQKYTLLSNHTHLTLDGYQENGSVADLQVNEQQSDSLRSRLGGRISYAYDCHGITLTPHLSATWQHEFMDQSRGITSQFNTTGLGSFSVQTDSPQRDFAMVDAGVTADLNRTVSVFAEYMAQAGQDNYFGQSVQAGVKIGF